MRAVVYTTFRDASRFATPIAVAWPLHELRAFVRLLPLLVVFSFVVGAACF